MMSTTLDQPDHRLDEGIRPRRCDATLRIDLAARSFTGRLAIELELAARVEALVIHAVELTMDRVDLRTPAGPVRVSAVEPHPASETLRLVLSAPVGPGRATLELAWSGRFCAGLRGLYDAGAGIAATQFEAADARRVFPCFDEPAFKAPWSLTVEALAGAAGSDAGGPWAILSNGAAVAEGGVRAVDARRVTFRETPPLPTYLVAVVAGPIAPGPEGTASGVPVRTWAVPEKVALTAFGQEVALAALPRLEEYFDVPYGFGKLDQVALPEFEAGAMENAGLVTFREVALLLDPATASLAQRKRVAEVVTHELAHMWFGNWVTMRWWDDLWLNEAFATWMAFKIVDGWRPGWRLWLDFDKGKAAALSLDALASTHPVRSEVRTVAEATEAFDLITYEKGGAVLRMIEGWLGEEPFRAGIRLYMRRHAKGNATADDLWGALAEASSLPVVELANAWIRQPGHPVLAASREGRTLRLAQRRFYSQPGAGADDRSAWPVPLVVKWEDGAGRHELRALIRRGERELELPGEGPVRWVFANGGATGFYRVAYDAEGLASLAAHLGALEPAERIALLSDEWALLRSGERDVGPLLDLLFAFARERDHAVLEEVVGRLAALEYRLVADSDLAPFRARVAGAFAPALRDVGWDPAPGESDGGRLRRAALLRAVAGVARDAGAVAEATSRLDRFVAGDRGALEPNLLDVAVTVAARGGDADRFDRFAAFAVHEPEPTLKRRYLYALAAFEAPELAARAIALAQSGGIPLQESAGFAGALLSNPFARERAWARLRDGWGALHERLAHAPMLVRRAVEGMGGLVERRQLEEAEAFLAGLGLGEAKQAVAQTLERLGQDVALRERAIPGVTRWLRGG